MVNYNILKSIKKGLNLIVLVFILSLPLFSYGNEIIEQSEWKEIYKDCLYQKTIYKVEYNGINTIEQWVIPIGTITSDVLETEDGYFEYVYFKSKGLEEGS